MNIHFSTLRSVCRYRTCTYRQWNEDWTISRRGACCEHEDNPECECKEKFCPLKTIKK